MSSSKKRIKFDDLPGWSAEDMPKGEAGFKIYNDKNQYIAYFSKTFKQMFIVEPQVPSIQECKNLHQAMRYTYLKTQQPKSEKETNTK